MGYGSVIKVPFGPQHPALKEPEHFTFEVEGDVVVNVKPRIGYNHRGIEKAFERRTYIQNIYLAERICGICSDAHTTCYTQAIENLLGVEAPPRAKYIRVIIAELERIHSHSLWVGIAAHEIGFDTLFMYVWRDREVVMNLFEMISGNRVNYATNTIGGVRRDIPSEMFPKIKKGLDVLEKRLKYYLDVAQTEQTILKRTSGVGILKPKDAVELCAVGPILRASGINNDVRADDPYAAYVEIPMAVPEGETVSRVEAPRGELIHYAKSNGTMQPERYKVRSPTLGNIPALCKMLLGGRVADIPIVLAGIDPCFACMDRMAFVDLKTNKKWVWTMDELKEHVRRNNL